MIVDRRVNVGQTVVASLNAPSLFLIAKDLKRLQLWASVNEADIGQIHPDQTAKFTVDAYPHKTFHGVVSQIRLNATMTQNVVTYTVVVNTDNSNGQLLPYLTANVQFEIAHRDNVLLVPTAALRWRPQTSQVVAEARDAFIQSTHRHEGQRAVGKRTAMPASKGAGDEQKARPLQARGPQPFGWKRTALSGRSAVQTGLTDGTRMEIVSGDLKEGTQIVVGEQRHEEGAATKNPFLPSFFRGASRKGAQKGQ